MLYVPGSQTSSSTEASPATRIQGPEVQNIRLLSWLRISSQSESNSRAAENPSPMQLQPQSQKMSICDRHPSSTSLPNSTGKTESETNSVPPFQPVESEQRLFKHICSLVRLNQDSATVVAESGEPKPRHPFRTSPLHASPIHRHISKELGILPSGHNVSRDLVSGRVESQHKQLRDENCQISPLSLQHSPKVPHSCCLRQHYRRGLH